MQVVGYDTGLGSLTYDPVEGITGEPIEPALLVAEEGRVRRVDLGVGTGLSYTLGARRCAGAREGDVHEDCDAPTAPFCERHADDWPCARCMGECDKPLPTCDEEHAVYLAAFAPALVKVGVTRLPRLPERLREQGADRAAHLHTVSDGRLARRVERELAASVPDRVGIRAKLDGLAEPFDEAAWAETLADFDVVDTYAFDYGLELEGRPVAETLATGTVVGTKGRLLVLERAGSRYAVDLRDLIGHELEAGATDRDIQSSLGAFG